MSDGHPHPTIDELLDQFIAAWHAGAAPSADAYLQRAAAGERDELAELIGAFLQLAPTVEPATTRGLELVQDQAVHRLAQLEDAWWDAKDGGAAAGAAAADAWGTRLRELREHAGLSLAALGARFAERFSLAPDEAALAPDTLQRLEAGEQRSSGVTSRAARALEELLGAARGALSEGAAPPLGAALLRGTPPPDEADEREQLSELLRQVDDALPPADDSARGETLRGLLGS